jgi:hypothetical protein
VKVLECGEQQAGCDQREPTEAGSPKNDPNVKPRVVATTEAAAIAPSVTQSGAPTYTIEKPTPSESRLIESEATNNPQPRERSRCFSPWRNSSTIMYAPTPTKAAKPR